MCSNHTRTHKSITRTAVVAMATGVAALMLTIPGPAQAKPMFPLAPACDNWEIGPTAFAIVVDVNGGWLVEFYGWSGKSLTATPGGRPAFGEHYTPPPPTTGPAVGNINGRAINMTVDWTEGPAAGYTHTFTGQIDDNGVASGNVTDNTGNSRTWRSHDKARCVTAPPPPAPAPPPPAPTPSEITLRYDPPTFTGITAFVGITNNANKPPVDCTYSDGVTAPRPFTVTGSAESRIDIAGIPTGTVFHVTVTCDNGLSRSENKSF